MEREYNEVESLLRKGIILETCLGGYDIIALASNLYLDSPFFKEEDSRLTRMLKRVQQRSHISFPWKYPFCSVFSALDLESIRALYIIMNRNSSIASKDLELFYQIISYLGYNELVSNDTEDL